MPASRLPKIKKALALLFLAFIALFVIRFLLGFVVEFERPAPQASKPLRARAPASFDLKNYRLDCVNNLAQIDFDTETLPNDELLPATQEISAQLIAQLEVFTREAQVGALTSEFDADVRRALTVIKKFESLVRLESDRGVKPSRYFSVVIRVPLDNFDRCIADLKQIGQVQTINITKQDKSEEVRRQFAQRESLRQHLLALTKLRTAGGRVSELANLEVQIQSIQQQIQSMSVALGDFVKKDSYNNVNFSLTEQVDFYVDEEEFPLSARAVESLVWTVQWYITVLAGLGVVLLTRVSWQTLLSAQ